ncbi:ABC transporter permease [uncultured Arcticibacterium sp.]|uniref:ABC transporter permease n=1 Tax=uncultured Arcticibacterium sp. TaxID=2173042 RepID=UPI0030F5222F
MLKNHIKIAWRTLVRNRVYSIINISGLAVGMTVTMLISLWIWDEISFDKYHQHSDRIFKVLTNNTYENGKIETYPVTPSKLKDVIKNEIPEVEQVSHHSFGSDMLIKHGNNSYVENGLYADSYLFKILDFSITDGSKAKPLHGLNSISISKSLSKKLFKNDDPIGKTLQIAQKYTLQVSSVFEDTPKNSSLRFDYILPIELFLKENPWTQNWQSGAITTLVLLKPKMSPEQVNLKLAGLIKKNCSNCTTTPFIFQYSKLRLYSDFENGKNAGGKIWQIILFGVIAFFILAMACINFINISIAKSTIRMKEVGVRKSIGAPKSNLVFQFMTEALLTSFIAMGAALFLLYLSMPLFQEVTEKSISLWPTNPFMLAALVLLTILTGVLAGGYPAFLLSNMKPIKAFKDDISNNFKGAGLRKFLVIGQFATAILLVIGSILVYKQMDFINKKNLGFNKSNILVVDQNDGILNNYASLQNEIKQLPFVKNMAFAGSSVFTVPITSTDPEWNGKPNGSSLIFKILRCDDAFIPTMEMEMLAGRNFSSSTDSSNYIINSKAMKAMSYTLENAIGQKLKMWNGEGRIIGVLDDFHNDNLQSKIQPMVLMYSQNLGEHYYIKISESNDLSSQIAQLKAVFNKNNAEYPFEYTLLEDAFKHEYKTEAMLSKLSLFFTFIGIFISAIGLFSLSSFVAEQRTKEIGIRKVLGASVSSLLHLMSKEFFALVLVACLIAAPISWYFMNEWLQKYTYRIEISGWVFFLTAIGALALTLFTISFQVLKTSLRNPVDSLRNE